MARMYEQSVAGRTEQEIWAELHYENIRSGGEWIETRLLRRRASAPTRGTRSARTTSPGAATCWPSTPT